MASNSRQSSKKATPAANPSAAGNKLARELFGLFLLFWGLLLLLSLVTHNATDPSLNHVVSGSGAVKNGAGVFGAYVSGLLVDVFGLAAYVWPGVFLAWGAGLVSTWFSMPWWRWFGFVLLGGCLVSLGAAWDLGIGDVRGGGILGMTFFRHSVAILGDTGSLLLWFFLFFLSLELAFGVPWMNILTRFFAFIRQKVAEHRLVQDAFPNMLNKIRQSKLSLPGASRSTASETTVDVIPLFEIHDETADNDFATADEDEPRFLFDDAIFDMPAEAVRQSESPLPSAKERDAQEGVTDLGASAMPQQRAENVTAKSEQESANSMGRLSMDVSDTNNNVEQEQKRAGGFGVLAQMVSAFNRKKDDAEAAPYAEAGLQTDAKPQAEHQAHSNAATGAVSAPEIAQNVAPPKASEIANSADATGDAYVAPPHHDMSKVVFDDPIEAQTPTKKAAVQPKKTYKLPPLSLLQAPQQSDSLPSRASMEEKGLKLMACLDDFNIRGELVRVTPGPVVTMFEVRPAPGVKVARIANLSQDMALSLKAEGVRIQAPIPGSDTVGIEVPNEERATVNFRHILESAVFSDSPALLTMALGKDISGQPEVADLVRMPHALVAGATGAGKSVCLNSLLVSILYKATPDEVKLLLIDPKKIELAVYADLPHLVHPVVTETPLAKTALDWAVNEMTERYNLMGLLKVRNILGYNEKLRAMGENRPEGMEDLEPLPYLVIIIDELADLMMTGGKEVEASIVRLAQLARACGIHLIIATQRPSVDVVTGLIKANFPCRIAFQVANKYDSRTILDSVGAELLLGRGDMLFKPSGGKLKRLHGPFVSDDDVIAVVEYWKSQSAPNYAIDFSEWGTEADMGKQFTVDASASDEEALYAEIVNFVTVPGQKISISKLQRNFRIGYNKAARFMERLEEDGVLEPAGVANRARQVRRD